MTEPKQLTNVREFLDNWRLWMAIAYFALAGLVIALFFLQRDLSRQQADRAAEQKSAAVSQVSDCVTAVENLPDIQALIALIHTNAQNSLQSSRQALRADPTSKLANVRRRSIRRTKLALARLDRVGDRIMKNTPTPKECRKLARRLNVPYTPTKEGS